jgi:heme A synthase
MESPWLHSYAVLLAACSLVLVMSGIFVSSNSFERGHVLMGITVDALTVGLVLWLSLAEKRVWLRRLGWIALAAVSVESLLGGRASLLASLSHAYLALLFFSTTVAIAVFTSRRWNQGPEPVQENGRPPMRSLAIVAPFLVLCQAALGTAFRHKAISLAPHILGAMIVALVTLVLGVCAMQQFPTHRSLRPAAASAMGITFAQVFLGVAVLSVEAMFADNTPPTVISVVAHVGTGAMTLAATLVLSVLIRRNVCPKPESTMEP